MLPFRYLPMMLAVLLVPGLLGSASAQTPAQPPRPGCGPDHAILYKRASTLLDNAEKKLSARYTAEAKALVKEANSLFTILLKECGPFLPKEPLGPKEAQQEAINQKLAADERTQAERLEKSAEEKFKKSQQLEAKQPELSDKLMRESKEESEQANKRYIKAEIYALRNQQMIFRFLSP